MLSSTLLKKLLDAKKFFEFQEELTNHYSSKDKLDIASSQKVTNLIAYQIANDKDCGFKVLSLLVKAFQMALKSLVETTLEADIAKKVFDSCYHVLNRICKNPNQDHTILLQEFLPSVEDFGVRFKKILDSYKIQEPIVKEIISYASKVSDLALCRLALNFYYRCASDVKQQNMTTGTFKLVKDICSVIKRANPPNVRDILDELLIDNLAKLHVLFLKLDLKLYYFNGICDEMSNIFTNNLDESNQAQLSSYLDKFLYITCTRGHTDDNLELIEIGIRTAEAFPQMETIPSLFRMYHVKFIMLYEKMKEYGKALDAAEKILKHWKSASEMETAVKCFVSAKRKTKWKGTIQSTNVDVKKFELKVYRQFRDCLDCRVSAGEEFLKIAQDDENKILAHLEIMWAKYAKNDDLGKSIDKCERLLKLAKNEQGLKSLVHFWLAICKIGKARKDLKQIEVNPSKKDEEEKILNIGDLSSVYSKVLDLPVHLDIIEHLKHIVRIDYQDVLFDNEDKKHAQSIVFDILDIINEVPDALQKPHIDDPMDDLLNVTFKLLSLGHMKQVAKTVKTLEKGLKSESLKDKLKLAKLELIKGEVMILDPSGKNPMECGRQAFRQTATALSYFNKNPCYDFQSLNMFWQTMNLMGKARHFFIKILMSVGLTKEMRMLAKMCVDGAVEIGLLPHLCQELLTAIEVDLLCDDTRQAQVKLREVETMMNEELKTDSHKIRTKASSNKENKLVLPNEGKELLCASPSMFKIVHGLPIWLLNAEPGSNEIFIGILLKYFTFQGVVWHFEDDNDAMSIYFLKVINVIKRFIKGNRCSEDMLTCLKWIMECYAHLGEFNNYEGVLDAMKSLLYLQSSPYWMSVYKEASVSLSMAKKTRNVEAEPSPIRPGTLTEADTRTPSMNERPRRLPQIKAKRFLPVNSDIEVKKMSELNLNEDDDEGETEKEEETTTKKTSSVAASSSHGKRSTRSSAAKKYR